MSQELISLCFKRGKEAASSGLYISSIDGLEHWNNPGYDAATKKQYANSYKKGYKYYKPPMKN